MRTLSNGIQRGTAQPLWDVKHARLTGFPEQLVFPSCSNLVTKASGTELGPLLISVLTDSADREKIGNNALDSGAPKTGSMTFLCRLWLFPRYADVLEEEFQRPSHDRLTVRSY